MSGEIQLLEFVQHTGSLQVDPEAGIIRGVRILGLESANGRSYTREAVSKARGLYEGKQVNVDHPDKPAAQTTVARRFGWLESVVQEADGGLRGNLHYLKSHPLAPAVIEAAQRRPQLLGLSHNAHGQSRRQDGRDVIESIDTVHSVDLVADPATVQGLHESRNLPVKKHIRDLIESLKAKRPGYSRALKEMADSGLMSPDREMDDPGACGPDDPVMPEAPDHEEALKQGFRGAIMAVLDDTSMDLKGKLKKISDILKTEEKLLGGDKGSSEPPPASDTAAEESRKLRLENTGLRLLLEAGISKPSKTLKAALQGCTTEAAMKELIEENKPTTPSGRPGAKSAAWNGGGNGTAVQEGKKVDVKALGARLKS